jgi:hypothetical protein
MHLRRPAAAGDMSEAATSHTHSPVGPAPAVKFKSPEIQVGGRVDVVDTRPPPPLEWRLIDGWLIDKMAPGGADILEIGHVHCALLCRVYGRS